jgi:hypothetical protein
MTPRVDTGFHAAKRQQSRTNTAVALVHRILTRKRGISVDEAYAEFWLEYRRLRDSYEGEVVYGWFVRTFNNWTKKNRRPSDTEVRERAAREVAIKRATEILKVAIRGSSLLDHIVFGDRRLADLTGAECQVQGDIFSAIAHHVPLDRRVGDVLTEDQIREIIIVELGTASPE